MMKNWLIAFCSVMILCGIWVASAFCATSIYSSGTVNERILTDTTTYGNIIISDDLIVTDINVQTKISHANAEDLYIYLDHSDGRSVELSTRNGGSGNNYWYTVFDDEAEVSIRAGVAPFSGSYQPEGLLSDFDGVSAFGDWQLRILNRSSAVSGTLVSWELRISSITIDTLSPAAGLIYGGGEVVINGDQFGDMQGNGTVLFGGQEPTVLAWSDNEITCELPAHAAGAVEVAVTNNNGFTVTKNEAFTYCPYLISSTAASNGSISPDIPQYAAANETTSYTITPDTGYRIDEITGCNGTLDNNIYTTSPASENCTVSVTFTNIYTVTPLAQEHGAISPSFVQNAVYNSSVSFTISPEDNYHINTVTGCDGILESSTYTTGPIISDCTIEATFVLDTYTLTPVSEGNGAISPAMQQSVDYGSTVVFTINPDANYHIASVTGCGGTLEGNIYTSSLVDSDCTITATFAIDTYTLTPSAGEHGYISPATLQIVDYGSIVDFALTPGTSYHIADVTGCGGTLAGNIYTTSSIDSDCAVLASFVIDTHTVTPSAGEHGALSPATSQATDYGTTLDFTVIPDVGYHIDSISGCDGSLVGSIFTTGIITADCTVQVIYAIDSFAVTPAVGEHGSLSPAIPQTIDYGSSVTFITTPDIGYHINAVSGCGGSLVGNIFTTGSIIADCSVQASFAIDNYTITPLAGEHGIISPAIPQSIEYGTPLFFTLTPDTGYHVGSVSGCEGTLAGNTYTIGIITDDCTVDATFAIDTHIVTPTAGEHGTISPATPQTIGYGSTVAFTVTPATGYHIDSVSGCNGSLVDNIFTTGVITSDCTVESNFAIDTYTVTTAAGEHGALSPATPQTADYGSTIAFTVTPDTGYYIDSIKGCNGTLSGNTYSTGFLTSDCTVQVTFSNLHDVTPTAGLHGVISPDAVKVVEYGSSTSFTITPDEHYHISSVAGCDGTLENNIYTTGIITANCAVQASFVIDTFGVTPLSCEHGVVSPATVQAIDYGSTASFTLTPNTGYHIDTVSGCDGTLDGAVYTTDSIAGECSVQAVFVINTYTLIPSAGEHGAIFPTEPQIVEHGATVSFTLTPENGYRLESLSGCEGTLTEGVYTIDFAESDCTLDVAFRLPVLNVPTEYSTIQAAIDDAVDGDTIVVADGIYTGVGNRDMDFNGKTITVTSENGPDNCIIDCQGLGRAFYFHNGEGNDAMVSGVTITNGVSLYDGGAVKIVNMSSPTIIGCIFNANDASTRTGGAIVVSDSGAIVKQCEFTGNKAEWGAAIYNYGQGAKPTISDCYFTNNQAVRSGAITNAASATPIITNCVFMENASGYGAAIYNSSGASPTITNCLFFDNSASVLGGGIENNTDCTPIISNCTFYGNSGGAIFNKTATDSPVITNTIIWGNDIAINNLGGAALTVTYSDIEGGYNGTGNIDVDPQFVNVLLHDFNLSETSPCLDTGTADNAPLDDLNGLVRPQGTGFEMGAYELLVEDADNDGLTDSVENNGCTDANDADSDDDGILDGTEDLNHDGIVDPNETNPCSADTDSDGVQDGTESGLTLADIGDDTDTAIFQPDLDPSTTTDATDADTDDDGLSDGEEDHNFNGAVDVGETDPTGIFYTIIPLVGEHGTISPAIAQVVDIDSTVVFMVIPDAGYHMNSISGCDGTLTENIYTVDSVTTDCSVVVSFTPDLEQSYVTFPDTGQAKCYDNSVEIACPQKGEPFYGQDAQYNEPQRSYTKLGYGGIKMIDSATVEDGWLTVRDNVTGLIWEVKTDDDGIHDRDNKYTWCDTNPETNGGVPGTCGDGTDTEVYIQSLNDQNYGGYDDWRMPSVHELAFLTDIRNYSPAIDKNYFPHTQFVNYYWSSTTDGALTYIAWHVSFAQYGGVQLVGNYPKSTPFFVRAVRGNNLIFANDFLDNGDGTVTDNTTGLVWQKESIGSMTWEEALQYSNSLALGGESDWRLPNINELMTIFKYNSRIYNLLNPVSNGSYWTSTSIGPDWVMIRYNGSILWGADKEAAHSYLYLRSVRGLQNIKIANDLSIKAINPINGSTSGNTPVIIFGSQFGDLQENGIVFFGETAATVTNWSDTEIECLTPYHVAGTVNVTVTLGNGESVVASPAFNYLVEISNITLNISVVDGGSSVTISGNGFGDIEGIVMFDTTSASITSWTETEIICIIPPHAEAIVDIVISREDGQTYTQSEVFTYGSPTVSTVIPTEGPTTGNTKVTITGTNFGLVQGSGYVTVDDVVADVTHWSPSEIICKTPVHADGMVDVEVFTDDGQSVSSPLLFTYYIPISISSVSPDTGTIDGGTTVIITGSGFSEIQGDSTITFDGSDTAVTNWSDAEITCVAPPGVTQGAVDVSVNRDDGKSATAETAFEYYLAISSVLPERGVFTGGTTVTISGIGFGDTQGTGTVDFGGALATVSTWSPTEIVITTPDHISGETDVTVTRDDSFSTTLTAAYIFIIDNDADGIDDTWEIENFGDFATADETTDTDDDSILDIDEYVSDTDPNLHWQQDGLVAYYPFNGNANDQSANDNHGVIEGASLTTDRLGNTNSAFSFDGIDDHIEVADSDILDDTAELTISLYFNANDFTTAGLISKRVSATTDYSYGILFWNNSPRMYTDIDDYNDRFTTNSSFETDTWYNIAVVFDGRRQADQRTKVYVNGILDRIASESSNIIPNYIGDLRIGGLASTASFFDGLLDDIRIYNRALSEIEVWALFNEPVPLPVLLSNLEPTIGLDDAATQVTISGANFGTIQGTVTFGGQNASIVSWIDTVITCTTPSHAAGSVDVVITRNDGASTTEPAAFTYYGDSDGDGINDAWEIHHFGDTTTVTAATDWDNDGATDLQEYLTTNSTSHTDPKVPDSRFNLVAGMNLVSVPLLLDPPLYASELLTAWSPSLHSISRLDQTTQTVEIISYSNGISEGVDFVFVPGDGYTFTMAQNTEKLLVGSMATDNVDLITGMNWVGFIAPAYGYSAYQLLQDIGDTTVISSIQRFNKTTGMIESVGYQNGNPVGPDFPIIRGEGYFINMHQDVIDFMLP